MFKDSIEFLPQLRYIYNAVWTSNYVQFYRPSHTAKDGDCSSGKNGRTLGKGLNVTGPRQEHPKGPRKDLSGWSILS